MPDPIITALAAGWSGWIVAAVIAVRSGDRYGRHTARARREARRA